MLRYTGLILGWVLFAVPAQAQIFDRQFVAAGNFSSDNGAQRQAFRQFVGRHAFAGAPIGGFFGCNGQGGGECNRSPGLHQPSGEDRNMSEAPPPEDGMDDGGQEPSCP